MGMIKYFLEFPRRHPYPTVLEATTWLTIAGSVIIGALILFVWMIVLNPWLLLLIVGGWLSFSCYYYWYYEIAKVNSLEKRYERNTE